MTKPFTLIYEGREAKENRLDLYDASTSFNGLARTLAVIGHFYVKAEIIAHAPRSAMQLYIVPPEDGSFKQTIMAAAIGGIVGAPFTVFATRLIESWIPSPNPQMEQMLVLMREQNELLRKAQGLPPKSATPKENVEIERVDQCLRMYDKELQTLRSITSNSFKNIFRPIGRSADMVGLIGGQPAPPTAVVDVEALAKIEADEFDDEDVIFLCVVNSFSRGSKTGIVFSRDFDMGFRIEYKMKGRLPREDDFSWSQFTGQPIRVHGRFVRFYDGTIKKFLVYSVERITRADEVQDYFTNQREVRTP